jgi:REP element-mobilizing transposase RayT
MARQLRIEFPGAFYHVTSRGNEKAPVFLTDKDRERFLGYLELAHQRFKATFLVYCCMENHFHLFLQTPLGNLSRIMHFINTGYSAYFNKIHERIGHLFQGRYKAILVDADEYAKELSRYIHLNPVRAEIMELPEQYQWSSYREYIGLRRKPVWMHTEFVLGYFGKTEDQARRQYAAFVKSGLHMAANNPFENLGQSNILGSDIFIERVKTKCLGDRKLDRELPSLRALNADLDVGPTINEIKTAAEKVFGKRSGFSRNVTIYLAHKYTGNKLEEIGHVFKLGVSGTSSAISRIEEIISKDLELGRSVKEIEEKLFR